MPEFLKKISEQLTEFWNKFDNKHKVQIIIALLVTIGALVLLTITLSKPKMVPFVSGLEPKVTSEVKTILDEQQIKYEIRDNATSVYVESKRKQEAQMALDSMGVISNTGMTYEDAFNTGLSTTETEKRLRYQKAFETELGDKISSLQNIESAKVTLVIPEESRLINDESKESKASAILKTKAELTNEQVVGIANFLASSVEKLELKNVKIIDSTGKMLFYGESLDGNNTSLNSKLEYKLTMERKIKQDVISILLARGEFDDAVVSVDLVLDFNAQSSVSEEYYTPDGQSKGIPSSEYHYESEGNSNAPSGVPGTDTNNGVTDYYVPDNSSSESSTTVDQVDYDVSKKVINETKNVGDVVYDESTIAIVVNKFRYYDEAILDRQGALEDLSWDEFQNENSAKTKIEVDEDITELVKTAANISNVQIIGYEVPMFISKQEEEFPIKDYLILGVIVLMIALLGYAVYKGTEPVEITEVEPELSVEDMLASTREQQELEEIEYDDKSETRIQIEKFVDEKPDAVAQLLRNWLNEDWE